MSLVQTGCQWPRPNKSQLMGDIKAKGDVKAIGNNSAPIPLTFSMKYTEKLASQNANDVDQLSDILQELQLLRGK